MDSLQEMMSQVMARQAVEDQGDTFAQDVRRVATRLGLYQEPETEDTLLIQAAEVYLAHFHDPAPEARPEDE